MTHLESNSMFELQNYNFSEKIFENAKFRIQRGVRKSDNESVLVKFLTLIHFLVVFYSSCFLLFVIFFLFVIFLNLSIYRNL